MSPPNSGNVIVGKFNLGNSIAELPEGEVVVSSSNLFSNLVSSSKY